jgi:hypothetical protein
MRIKGKRENKFKKMVPGPGTYDPSHDRISIKKTIPAISIGTAHRSELHNTNPFPGPGSYQHKKYRKKGNPKFSFGKEKRKKMEFNQTTPGPGNNASNLGNYEVGGLFDTGLSKGLAYSMSSKRPISAKGTLNMPGPGAYDLDGLSKTRPKTPGWK